MDSEGKPDRSSDRRARERRVKQVPFDGGDKRAAQRRSLSDRRTSPRA